MDAFAPAPVDAAEIRQEPQALRERRARAAVQVVGEPIVPGLDVRPIAPEQLVQIGHHLLEGRQRTFDLRRLDDRRREPPGELGMRVKPGDAGSLAEVVGDALERIHPAVLSLACHQDMARAAALDQRALAGTGPGC